MASRRQSVAMLGEPRRVAATDRRTWVLTGALLIAVPVLFNVFYFALQATFEYPDILRQPADEILRRFAAGGPGLIATWYGFALVPAFFLPAAVLLRRVFGDAASPGLALAAPLAVVASLVQLLGLLRWPFLVPALAATYLAASTDAATRAAAVTVFAAFHQYAGVAVGEYLGYLFTGAWTAVIAGAMLTAPPRPAPRRALPALAGLAGPGRRRRHPGRPAGAGRARRGRDDQRAQLPPLVALAHRRRGDLAP